MKTKKIFAFFAAAVLAANITATSAFAHSMTDCGLKHTVSTTHWDLYENSVHWSSYAKKMTVDCGVFEGSAFETYINNAVTKWDNAKFNNKDLMSIGIDNESGCVLFRNKSADQMARVAKDTTWAVTYREKATDDGTSYNHYSTEAGSIEIWINYNTVLSTKTPTSQTHVPIHELGHVIGLVDIPKSVSINSYLMCNDFGSSAAPTTITTTDAQGAAVILGQHTAHSYTYSKYNSSTHKKTCSICAAYKYENHTYSNNVCKYCGYNKTTGASITDYEEYDNVLNDDIAAEFETEVEADVENLPSSEFTYENDVSNSYDLPFYPDVIN